MLFKPDSKDQVLVVFRIILIMCNLCEYIFLITGGFFFTWKLTTNQRTVAVLG